MPSRMDMKNGMRGIKVSIRRYQKRCFREYKSSIGIAENYHYLYGNPINVQVPIETALHGVMIVGAYPSAKFYKIGDVTDVPLLDNDAPFSNEAYFDGSRVRRIPSGEELEQSYLIPLNISRKQCWITDLVKVFLFKSGHVKRYQKLGEYSITENRSRFRDFAERSLPWLEEEVKLASPRVVILLGQEITSVLFQISSKKAKDFLDGTIHILLIGETHCHTICLPHPGIIMKPSPKNPWPERFENEIIPRAKLSLRGISL